MKFSKKKIKTKKALHKVGKRVAKAQNYTSTTFKAKNIVISDQSIFSQTPGITSNRQLSVDQLVSRLGHGNDNVKAGYLVDLKSLLEKDASISALNDNLDNSLEEKEASRIPVDSFSPIIRVVLPLIGDISPKVRIAARGVTKTLMSKHRSHFQPHVGLFFAYMITGLSSLDKHIKEDTANVLCTLLNEPGISYDITVVPVDPLVMALTSLKFEKDVVKALRILFDKMSQTELFDIRSEDIVAGNRGSLVGFKTMEALSKKIALFLRGNEQSNVINDVFLLAETITDFCSSGGLFQVIKPHFFRIFGPKSAGSFQSHPIPYLKLMLALYKLGLEVDAEVKSLLLKWLIAVADKQICEVLDSIQLFEVEEKELVLKAMLESFIGQNENQHRISKNNLVFMREICRSLEKLNFVGHPLADFLTILPQRISQYVDSGFSALVVDVIGRWCRIALQRIKLDGDYVVYMKALEPLLLNMELFDHLVQNAVVFAFEDILGTVSIRSATIEQRDASISATNLLLSHSSNVLATVCEALKRNIFSFRPNDVMGFISILEGIPKTEVNCHLFECLFSGLVEDIKATR